jgi:hypothetical protein
MPSLFTNEAWAEDVATGLERKDDGIDGGNDDDGDDDDLDGGFAWGADRGRADFKIFGRGLSIDLDLEPLLPVPTAEKPVAHSIGRRGIIIIIITLLLLLFLFITIAVLIFIAAPPPSSSSRPSS